MSFQSSNGPASQQDRPFWRRFRITAALVFGLILVLALGLWFARKPIATRMVNQWCQQHDLTCLFEIDQLTFTDANLRNIAVSGPHIENLLDARSVSIQFKWQRLFSPVLTEILVTEPSLRADFDGTQFTLDGLETLFTANRAETGTALPTFRITDGRLTLTTPAGQLGGIFAVTGMPGSELNAELVLAPANLRSGDDVLELQAGSLKLVQSGAQIDGKLDLAIGALTLGTLHAKNLNANAQIKGAEQIDLDWQIEFEGLNRGDVFSLGQTTANGDLRLNAPLAQIPTDLDAVETVTAHGQTRRAALYDYHAETVTFELAVDRPSPGQLGLRTAAEITKASSPKFRADLMTLEFDGKLDSQQTSLFGTGKIFLSDGALTSEFSQTLLANLPESSAIQAHTAQLRTALREAFSGFTTAAEFRLDATSLRDWQLIFPQALALQSRSGASASLTPVNARPALVLAPGMAEIAGIIALDGAGLPDLDADIRLLKIDGTDLSLQIGGLEIQPWQAGATRFSAELNRFNLESTPDQLAITAVGEVRVDGQLGRISLTDTRLFGGIDAIKDASNWRVQTPDQACLGLQIGGAKISSNLALGALALNICPENGRFIQQTAAGAHGRVLLGDIVLPFSGTDISGDSKFDQATLEWSTGNAIDFQIDADALDFSMLIGDRSLKLAAASPRAGLTFGRQTRLRANVGQSTLAGDLIPANVGIGQAEFAGQFGQAGFTGEAVMDNVEATDTLDDPRYQPLRADLAAQFAGPNITLTGPIRLASSRQVIADAALSMDLLALDGTAQITSRLLTFTREGLQPKALSDLVRGVLSNGRGSLSGLADFSIIGGAVTGTAQIEATDFGFDTLRLGAIDGINGSLYFSDLLALTTPLGQRMTIASMNPGIPLQDGEITFQIVTGERVEIAAAHWPFGGGSLNLTPATWTIAGLSDTLVINARQLELANLIDLFSLPDIAADGTLSGTFPIEFKNGIALIKQARFAVDRDGGTLAYTGNAAAQVGAGDERVNAAFTALSDFHFKILEVGIDGNLVDDVTMSVRLLGQNPDNYGGAEFDFRISIAAKFAQLIRSSRRSASISWLADVIALDPEPETDEPFN